MGFSRQYVFADELEQELEKFERSGKKVIQVLPYAGWLKPAGDNNPRLCDIKRGYEVLLRG